jgi:hypothetical protein
MPTPPPRFSDAEIMRRIDACPKLASSQSIYLAFAGLFSAEQSFNSQIAEIIRRDPSLTARLLRMVNSVYFGLSAKVNNIEEAVDRVLDDKDFDDIVSNAIDNIDLHDKLQVRPRVSLFTPDDNAQNLKQALGRIQRSGGTDSTQYIVYCADTIEDVVANNVREKIGNIDSLNDGDVKPVGW